MSAGSPTVRLLLLTQSIPPNSFSFSFQLPLPISFRTRLFRPSVSVCLLSLPSSVFSSLFWISSFLFSSFLSFFKFYFKGCTVEGAERMLTFPLVRQKRNMRLRTAADLWKKNLHYISVPEVIYKQGKNYLILSLSLWVIQNCLIFFDKLV